MNKPKRFLQSCFIEKVNEPELGPRSNKESTKQNQQTQIPTQNFCGSRK